MTLQDWGALGELIGGVAVIATVLYLAVQIRHGIRGYQSAAVQDMTSHFSRIQLELALNPELLEILGRSRDEAPLTEVEHARVRSLLTSYMIAFENMHDQYISGVLEREPYEARLGIIAGMLTSPSARAWWRSHGRGMHSESFANEVDRVLEQHGAP